MKNLITILTVLVTSSLSFAATIQGARLDDKKENLLIDVSYPGGCKEHKFKLQNTICLESMPPSCTFELIDETTGDICEAIVPKTISFSLRDNNLIGLDTVTITGALNWRTGQPSSATVVMPR